VYDYKKNISRKHLVVNVFDKMTVETTLFNKHFVFDDASCAVS